MTPCLQVKHSAIRTACVLNACLEEMSINPLVTNGRIMYSHTIKPIKTDHSELCYAGQ